MSASSDPRATDGARHLAPTRDEAAERAAERFGVSASDVRRLAEHLKRLLSAASQVVAEETGLPLSIAAHAAPPASSIVAQAIGGQDAPLIPLPRVLRLRDGDERDRILNAVADEFSVKVTALIGRERRRAASEPRQIAMWLIRRRTAMSLLEIGRQFGRDHTTVIYAVEKVKGRLSHPAFQERIKRIIAVLDEAAGCEREGAGTVE